MTILVTGALGHIGSGLIRELPLFFPDAKIKLLDNLMTSRYCSLFNLPKNGNYNFIEEDLRTVDLDELLPEVDVVVHLAAITDAAGSFEKAVEVENNNFLSTKNIGDACAKFNIKLITLSSTSVYGSQNSIVDENCNENELKPQSPYATTKLKEEKYINKLINEKNLKATVLRFGTIFGTSIGMRFHTAINKFCWQAVMGKPISVWETAFNQKRPYLDLNDATKAIIFIIKNDIFNGKIYNVVTHNLTVEDVVNEIKSHIPKLKIEFVNNPIMNQLSYEVSSDQFCKLGFIFEGEVKRGISETIELLKMSNYN
jgi:UDP-glucose 4-epimerase